MSGSSFTAGKARDKPERKSADHQQHVLYLLGGRCIAELPPDSFSEVFFFSVENLATVGGCVATL